MKHPVAIIFILILAGLLVWLNSWVTLMIWDGRVNKKVSIRLTQGDGRTPIPGATVIIMRDSPADTFTILDESERKAWTMELISEKQAGLTTPDGLVTLSVQFPAGGTKSIFARRGSFGIEGYLIIIKEDGSLLFRRLRELIPPAKRSLDDEVPPLDISFHNRLINSFSETYYPE